MAGRKISLRTTDGHELGAYEALPEGRPRGGLVLLQEIFGVTRHIRSVCDGYAAQGYHTIAPALFDRVKRDTELGYSKDDAVVGRELRGQIPWSEVFADVLAARERVGASGKTGMLGYCWGGTVSWRSATQLGGVAGAVCYYATQVTPYVNEKPRCPVLMHFGERDTIAPLEHAGALRAAQGALVEIQVYPASHGFNCDEMPNFDAASASLALRRSLEFLRAQIG